MVAAGLHGSLAGARITATAVQTAARTSAGARARATAQMVAAGLTGSLAGARSTVAGIAPHLRNIAGADYATAAHTARIAAKNFSPSMTVNAYTSISVSDVVRSLTSFRIADGHRPGI